MGTRKRKVVVCHNLGRATKTQRLLWKSYQDRARLKKLYVGEAMEHCKIERRLKIEIERTAFYCDCVEYLHSALIEAQSLNKEGIDGKIKGYVEFKSMAYANFIAKKSKLNKVEASAFGKHIVAYATDEGRYIS